MQQLSLLICRRSGRPRVLGNMAPVVLSSTTTETLASPEVPARRLLDDSTKRGGSGRKHGVCQCSNLETHASDSHVQHMLCICSVSTLKPTHMWLPDGGITQAFTAGDVFVHEFVQP
jgi:hypothetical protein